MTKRRTVYRSEMQKVQRAADLLNWFLEIFHGLLAPFPQKSLRGVAHFAEDFLIDADTEYRDKWQRRRATAHTRERKP